jgi:aminoglycoside phosphotransferase family enzyme
MRRLPERRMLDFLLDHGQVTPEMMDSLAAKLAPFHAQAAAGERIRMNGHPRNIHKLWDENLADIRPFVGRFINADTYEGLKDFGERFVARNENLLERRVRGNHIRDVHGDLHCEHVCFAPEGI